MKTRQSPEPNPKQSRRLSRTVGTSSRQPSSRRTSATSTISTRAKKSKSTSQTPRPILAAPSLPFDLASANLPKPPRRSRASIDPVRDYDSLITALKEKKVQITLGNNIVAPNNIVIDYDVAINLNGHCLISEQATPNARVIDIRRGEVTITGEGKIFAMGPNSTAIRLFGAISPSMPHYTQLTVDEKIQLFAPDGNGVVVSANLGVAYGLTLNFAGQIIAQNGICLSQSVRGRDAHSPILNIKSGSLIIADEEIGTAIDAAGIGTWRIGAAKIYGAHGLHVQSGNVSCEHTQIISRQAALEIDNAADADLRVTLDNGVYVSESDHVITGSPQQIAELRIDNGDFCSAEEAICDDLEIMTTIQDGNFCNDVAEYLQQFAMPDLSELQPAEPSSKQSAPASATLPIPPTPQPAVEPQLSISAPTTPVATPSDIALTQAATPDQLDTQTASPDIPIPKKPKAPKKSNVKKVVAERAALLANFSDAIESMQNLRSEDYASGFSEFKLALLAAEEILDDPDVSIAEIRDAADELLSAFDRLEERDELSLTDDELDQLFYHGAILQEVTDDLSTDDTPRQTSRSAARQKSKLKLPHSPAHQETKAKTPKPKSKFLSSFAPKPKAPQPETPPPTPVVSVAVDSEPPIMTFEDAQLFQSALATAASCPQPTSPAQPQHASISPAPAHPQPKPSSIQPQPVPSPAQFQPEPTPVQFQFTPISSPQPETASPISPQPSHAAFSPAIEASPLPNKAPTAPASTTAPIRPKCTTSSHPVSVAPTPPPKPQPQPIPTLSSCFIDELSPLDQWTTGATMIDELAPLLYTNTSTSRPKSRKKPPLTNFVKSLAIGVQAGFEAFHKTRQSAKK